jgi:hypothetical protein
MISESGLDVSYRSHYFPRENILKVFLKEGAITIDITSGEAQLEQIKRRPGSQIFLRYH